MCKVHLGHILDLVPKFVILELSYFLPNYQNAGLMRGVYMKNLVCDVCRKSITTAINGCEYVHIAHRELCEDCNDKLNAAIKPILRTKQPFNFEWYERLVKDSIEKAIAKGKW